MLAVELDELKGRAGSAWTSEKERAAEASAFQAPQAPSVGSRSPRPQAASSQRRFFLFRSR